MSLGARSIRAPCEEVAECEFRLSGFISRLSLFIV